MDSKELQLIVALRRQLHAAPEPSGHEGRTLGAIAGFLRAHTSLVVEDRGGWLLASRVEGAGLPELAFRAELDAISDGGGARHGCGHDGHCAILCALALMLEGRRVGANVRLVFQPAEETGEGAQRVIAGWPELSGVDRVYALHNLPGYPRGALLARPGCFACASEGFVVEIAGRPAHAAYPEDGANPATLLCQLTLSLPGMIEDILKGDRRLLMRTVVGLNLGGERFGMSASEGRLCLTLRGDRAADIAALKDRIREYARRGCEQTGMTCRFETREAFPDTTNPPEVYAECVAAWRAAGFDVRELEVPMRWSEDFGWYLKKVPGLYFGVGLGEDRPGLHTAAYEFDDGIIETAANALFRLIEHQPFEEAGR